jgi:hypothetical protein
MAKTRQNNIDNAFQSTEKLQNIIDKLAVSLDKLDTSLANATVGKSQADVEREKAEKKKADAEKKKADAAEKAALAAEKRATDDKDLTDFINKTIKDSETGMTRVKNFIGDNFSKDFGKVIQNELNLDSENLAIDKKIAGEIGDIFENIENIGTDKFKDMDIDALKEKRKEFEEGGASEGVLKQFDQSIRAAEYFDISMENVGKTMKGVTDIGNELIAPIKELPVLGPMISGALDKGLESATGKIKEKLVAQIFTAKAGTKGIQKGFLGTIPPINLMGTSIHIATGGITLLIGLLVAAAAALIGMTKRARDFAGQANIAFGQSFKLQGAITKADIALIGTGQSAQNISKQLIENFGTIDNVTSNNIKQIGRMSTRFGVATDDLIKFQKGFSDVTGASMDVANDVVRAVGSMATGAGVAAGAVIKDISSNMEAFARFSTEGAMGMAKAAVEAAKVGSSLDEVVKMADALLNFESSITAEFEAQVLTGKALNLQRAREAALQGDFATLTQEVQRQVGGLGNLQAMNVIQKDSIATALGISVAELTRIARGQEKEDEESPELKAQKRTNQILIDGFTGNKEALENIGKKSADSSGGMFGDFL